VAVGGPAEKITAERPAKLGAFMAISCCGYESATDAGAKGAKAVRTSRSRIHDLAHLGGNADQDVSYRELTTLFHGEGLWAGEGDVRANRTNVTAASFSAYVKSSRNRR